MQRFKPTARAQRQVNDPLTDQRLERMPQSPRLALVPKARSHLIDQTDRSIHLSPQQRPCIRRLRATVVRASGRGTRQRRFYPTAIQRFESKLFGDRLYRYRTRSGIGQIVPGKQRLRFLGPMDHPW